jgi:hypothetical protein
LAACEVNKKIADHGQYFFSMLFLTDVLLVHLFCACFSMVWQMGKKQPFPESLAIKANKN